MKAIQLGLILITGICLAQSLYLPQGDVLNEAPFYEIPNGMTFEEYRDANRRISVGLLLMSVPVPGMLHFYADDDTRGWICVGGAGLGAISIITGALLREDSKYPESDYETITIDGNRYEKIPFLMEGEQIDYQLRPLKKEESLSDAGVALIVFGGALIIGEIVYDWLDGIHTIEYKRDRVRYKYGIGDRDASISTAIGLDGTIGVSMAIE